MIRFGATKLENRRNQIGYLRADSVKDVRAFPNWIADICYVVGRQLGASRREVSDAAGVVSFDK